MAHSYTLTLTVGGDAVRSLVGSKPNEELEEPLEVRVAPPGVEELISSHRSCGRVVRQWVGETELEPADG